MTAIPQSLIDWVRDWSWDPDASEKPPPPELILDKSLSLLPSDPMLGCALLNCQSQMPVLVALKTNPKYAPLLRALSRYSADLEQRYEVYKLVNEIMAQAGLFPIVSESQFFDLEKDIERKRVLDRGVARIGATIYVCGRCYQSYKKCKHPNRFRISLKDEIVQIVKRLNEKYVLTKRSDGTTVKVALSILRPIDPLEALGRQAE